MQLHKMILIFTAAAVLSGCMSAIPLMDLSNSRGYCPPEVIQRASIIRFGAGQIQVGMDIEQVQAYMGIPEKWESYQLTDGRQMQVMMYRVGHPACSGYDGVDFLPVVFSDGRLMGYGQSYFNSIIQPAINRRPPAANSDLQLQYPHMNQTPQGGGYWQQQAAPSPFGNPAAGTAPAPQRPQQWAPYGLPAQNPSQFGFYGGYE